MKYSHQYKGNEDLYYHKGNIPILVLSIHSCKGKSPKSKKSLREFRITSDLCDMLVDRKPEYYLLKYTGYKKGCTKIIKEPIKEIVQNMIDNYGNLGVMSIHCRGKCKSLKVPSKILFELGDRRGKTLDKCIETNGREKLERKDIFYDYYNRRLSAVRLRTGGFEIKLIHEEYPQVQIAQLEFNDWMRKATKDTWMKQYHESCIGLANIYLKHLNGILRKL